MSKFNIGNTRSSKLSGEQVMEIRRKYASRVYTQDRLAREYQVTSTTIRNIVHGVTWQHLPPVDLQDPVSAAVARSLKRLESDVAPPEAVEIDPGLISQLAAELSTPDKQPSPLDSLPATVAAKAAFYTSGAKPELQTTEETHSDKERSKSDPGLPEEDRSGPGRLPDPAE